MRAFTSGLILGSTCVLVLALALSRPFSSVSAAPGGAQGAGTLGQTRQTFRWKNFQNNDRSATFDRTELTLPRNMGLLVQIAPDPAGTNLWFLDDQGTLQNVLVEPGLVKIRNLETIWDAEE